MKWIQITDVIKWIAVCVAISDLRRNYSLLVVPGYIGSNAILDKWSKIAYENKAFLVEKVTSNHRL